MDSKECVSTTPKLALSEDSVNTRFSSPSTSQPYIPGILKQLQDVAPKERKKEFISETKKTSATNTTVSSDVTVKLETPSPDKCKALPVNDEAFYNTLTTSCPSMAPSFSLHYFQCFHQNHPQSKCTCAVDKKNMHVRCIKSEPQALDCSNNSQCSLYEELGKFNEHSHLKHNSADFKKSLSQIPRVEAASVVADIEEKPWPQLIVNNPRGGLFQEKGCRAIQNLQDSAMIENDIPIKTEGKPRELIHASDRHPASLLHCKFAVLKEDNEHYSTKPCIRHFKTEEAESLQDNLTYDSSGPEVRQNEYWWTEEIAELRKACIKARRQYTRACKWKGDREVWQNRTEELHEVYKKARYALRNAIRKAKFMP